MDKELMNKGFEPIPPFIPASLRGADANRLDA
jgi:hypothetical protein